MKHVLIIDSDGKASRIPNIVLGPIAKYLATAAGKAALANSMIAPLVRNRGYADLARQCFQVQQLPPGAQPIYDRDIEVAGIIIPDDPQIITFKHGFLTIDSDGKLNKGRRGRVTIPKFEIYRNPTIKIDDVKRRRFNLIDRKAPKPVPKFKHNKLTINSDGKLGTHRQNLFSSMIKKTRDQIMLQEDEEIFKILDDIAASGSGNKQE